MRKKFSSSKKPIVNRQGVINFDTSQFVPNEESIKIYEELNAIAVEIDECRRRNLTIWAAILIVYIMMIS